MNAFLVLLGAVGATIVLTRGSIAEPVREVFPPNTTLGKMIRCAMCSGFWVGLVFAPAFLPLAHSLGELPITAGRHIAFAFATSLVAYLTYFVAMVLDEAVSALKKYTEVPALEVIECGKCSRQQTIVGVFESGGCTHDEAVAFGWLKTDAGWVCPMHSGTAPSVLGDAKT